MSVLARELNSLISVPQDKGKCPGKSDNRHISLGNADLITQKVKEEVLSLCSDFPSLISEKGTNPTSISNLLESSPLDNRVSATHIQNLSTDKMPKRNTYTKAGPKCRKKDKIQNNVLLDEEKKLDNDLLGIVASFNEDKNLDSDSSADTIIFDDTFIIKDGNSSVDTQSYLCSNTVNVSDERTTPSTTTLFKSSLQPCFSMISGNTEHVTLIKKEKESNESVGSSGSLLRDVLEASRCQKTSVLSSTSVQNLLSNAVMSENTANQKFRTPPKNNRTKQRKNIFDSVSTGEKKSVPSSVSSTSLFAPNLCQSNETLNYQSVYASMGLDEDLCDSERQASMKTSISKETSNSTLNPSKSKNPLLGVKIKIEKDEPSFTDCNSNNKMADSKNESLTSDGVHVSMLFEEEPPCDEEFEDGEEDLPLSLLKDQNSIDQIDLKVKPDPEQGNSNLNTKPEKANLAVSDIVNDDIHPSLFIKKELIEDEIISESQPISSTSILSVPGNKDIGSINLLPVKIKTEPIDTEYKSPESHSKNLDLMSDKTIPSQSLAYSTAALSAKSPKKNKKENSISKPEVSKANNMPIKTSLSVNSESKSECVNKLNNQVISAVPPRSTESNNTEVISAVVPNFSNMLSDSQHLNVKDLTPSVCDTRKRKTKKAVKSNKKKKSTKIDSNSTTEKFDLENFQSTEFVPHSELTRQIDDHSTDNVVDSEPTSVTNVENINLSKKKRKRKKKIVDENMPLTLLIKKTKKPCDANVDADVSDSFVCTNVSNKSSTGESQPSYGSGQNNVSAPLLNNSVQQLEDGASLMPETSAAHQKKKKKRVKKKIKKKSTVNIIDNELVQSESNTLSLLKVPFETNSNSDAVNLHSDINSTESAQLSTLKKSSTKFQNHEINSSSSFSSLLKISSKDQKSDSSVHLTSVEHSSKEENAEDIVKSALPVSKQKNTFSASDEILQSSSGIEDLLSVKKYKKKKIVSPALEELSNSSSCVNFSSSGMLIDESMSSKSELSNFGSEFSAVSKRKKRRARSNGWYKKKKPTKKRKNLPPVKTLPTQNPFSEIKNSLLVSTKQPVVVIENMLPQMEKITNNPEKVVQSQTKEQVPVISFRGLGRKGSRSQKRKKSSPQFKDGSPNRQSLQNSLSISKNCDISIIPDSLENFYFFKPKTFKNNHLKNCPAKKAINESGIHLDHGKKPSTVEHISGSDQLNLRESSTKGDSVHTDLTASKERHMFPSLNVEEIANEIAAFEEILKNRVNNAAWSSTVQNKIRSDLENAGLSKRNIDQHETSLINKNKNSSNSSVQNLNNTSTNVDTNDVLINSFRPDNFRIKKEFDVNLSKNSVNEPNQQNQNSLSPFNSFRRVLLNKESEIDKTKADSTSLLIDLTSIKKEKSVETHSLNEISVTESRHNSVSIVREKDIPVESVDNTIALSKPQGDVAQNVPKNSDPMNVDSLGLLIKKEVCDATKRIPSNNYVIRDQSDLIRQVCGSNSKTLVSINNPCITNSNITSILSQEVHSNSATLQHKNVVENLGGDEEIQVLPVEKPTKNVPCVDLTDDNYASDLIQKTQGKMAESSSITSIATKFIEFNKRTETGNLNSKSCTDILSATPADIRQVSVPEKQNCSFSFHKSNDLNSLDSSKIKTNVSASSFLEEGTYMSEDPIKRETNNPFIVRDKYIDEYFKHPFPPSLVLYNKKQRNWNKMYSRIDSKAWNLTLDEVESRLKQSENTSPQFGRKLGDVVKLDKYPVSRSEVECYHRILGVAPSHKLLSKCFVSPNKKLSAIINSEFKTSELQEDQKKFENKDKNLMTCTIDDILKGINETKMMFSNFNPKNDSSLFDRDCPSVDPKDSFDSCMSSVTDNFLTLNEETKNSNIFPIKENEIGSTFKDASSSGRNSALSMSCSMSDFQDSYKSGISNIDVSSIKNSDSQFISCLSSNEVQNASHSQSDILTNLTLPSQELINSILNNNEASKSTIEEISNVASNSFTESKNDTVNAALPSLSDNYAPVESCLTPEVKTNESQASLNINKVCSAIDLPVTELRKILETAGSLHSDKVNYENGVWKSKATFEYNHIQSYPVLDADSKQNEEVKSIDSGLTEINKNDTKQTENENSDDEYVDNEPIHYESDNGRDDSSSHEEDEVEEPTPIPQYKSKWEKIMERKSQHKDKVKVNEFFLKDCFPVSSAIKPQKKKSNMLDKKITQSTTKESKQSKEKECTKLPKSKSKKDSCGKKSKESQSKSKSDTYVEKQNKSSKISKNVEKEKSKTIESKDTKKGSVSVKKNKGSDDASNLFVPDKLVKSSSIKKPVVTNKSDEDNKSKRFYGNRITNRGTFLTETSSSELLKNIKIPKKKIPEFKKPGNVRSEEFHSMIKSPDININSSFVSSHRYGNKAVESRKNSEFYKSPLSDSLPSTTSHFVRTKKMRDRQNFFANPQSRFSAKNNPPNRKPTLLGDTPSVSACHGVNNLLNRQSSLLPTPSISSPVNDETMLNRTVPLVGTSAPSISSHHLNEENRFGQKVSSLSTPSSISSQLPTIPFQTNVNINLLQTIMSVFQNNSNPLSQGKDSTLPFSESMNSTWHSNQFNLAYGVNDPSVRQNENFQSNLSVDCQVATNPPVRNVSVTDSIDPRRAAALGIQSNMPIDPVMPVNTSFGNNSLAGSLDPRKAALGIPSVSNTKNHLDLPHDSGSQILNSPPCSTPVNSASQVSRKASCLVPQHLKSLVGRETIETHNVRLLILEWSVDWLNQQQKLHDPPPISKALRKVVSSYESFEDYYNTYFPLMLLETWQRIYVSWTHLNQTAPYLCQITSYSVKNHYVSIECQTVFNTDSHPKRVFPDEGSILMVKFSTKSNEYTIKILGYVTQVKTRRFNPVTDSKICSSLTVQKDANSDALQILTLTFMGAFNSEDIDKHQPVRIHVLCTVKHTLKQNDAMLYINKSPLKRSILNPVADGLLTFTLTPRNSPEEKVNECVRDVTKGILSPHPLPLLTVVRATPESDRLNIIPLLIQKMKRTYKTKVLLCVRTVRALGDIAANICLQQSLKLVIINKRCDTNPQFQKYLLDELVAAETKKLEEEKSGLHLRNELVIKIRKQILKDSDVVLSLIRNCHDEFMGETFLETESIPQMCCIVDEANLCTEPETLIPILYGISKLILIGDADYSAKVLSKTASSYDYNQSFFQRAYDLDLLTA